MCSNEKVTWSLDVFGKHHDYHIYRRQYSVKTYREMLKFIA